MDNINWNFSFGWMAIGILIFIIGGIIVYFYKPISDNIASGINSYERVKLVGLITSGVGLLVMMNLHTLLLGWFVSLFIHH